MSKQTPKKLKQMEEWVDDMKGTENTNNVKHLFKVLFRHIKAIEKDSNE
jgi:hypothetical protein